MAYRPLKPWSLKPPAGAPLNYGIPVTRGIQGAWLFNARGGLIATDGCGRRPGTLSGGAVYGKNRVNLTAASSHYVSISTIFPNTFSTWTIAALATKASTGTMALISQGMTGGGDTYNFYLRVGSATNMGFTVANAYSFLNTGAEPTLNVPHFFVGVYDGANLFYYVDGVLIASGFSGGGAGTPDNGSTQIFELARYAGYNVQYWDGSIDFINVYNRPLRQTEIQRLYSNPYGMYNSQTRIPFIAPPAGAVAPRRIFAVT